MVLPNKSGKDELVFLEESAPRSVAEPTRKPEVWRVLIIDDDEDVHTATVFALNNLEMQHRPLEFLHAYSAAEARRYGLDELYRLPREPSMLGGVERAMGCPAHVFERAGVDDHTAFAAGVLEGDRTYGAAVRADNQRT